VTNDSSNGDVAETPRRERFLGSYGDESGPLVVVIGGIHGNEPGGVLAAERVLARLRETRPRMRGRVVCVVGNLGALHGADRYRSQDLIRMWSEESLARSATSDPEDDDAEMREQRELLAFFAGVSLASVEDVVVLDLHSSSADGPPFSIMADTLQNRRIGFGLPIPVILGLEENLDGTLLGHFARKGYVALAVEGGRHEDEKTAEHLEAAIWLSLVSAGALKPADVPELEAHRASLLAVGAGLPRVIETCYRHALEEGHRFRMEPGFTTFHRVNKGQLLAHDDGGPVRSPDKGLVMLPLYQGQGSDGFFIGREVGWVWLWLSAVLRKIRVEALLLCLPGVGHDPTAPHSLLVDLRVARWLAPSLFNLLGYRGRRRDGAHMCFTRRREGRLPVLPTA